ncbi:PLP-dependent aminotransferase family protein [Pelosinus sp. UFO1]|uniref:MocR-like pyridoxine biosynthesis transcription factor PdxR n=1 Tax=Pelosinus sp. UFO1 TaxID=484770 RepID=UPI0004D0C2C7|nr:PLP-dependent aminotransferase family protein [Pelosinus sp. UFO1]AIF49845.1 transcriptional regulator, GntR family with aminotransferase domain containing protein [Pelosinus sp. UFO1]
MIILNSKGRQPLHDKIYNQIKNKILSGELPPATKLLSIKNLAIELSVSRNTVEYAYQQLFAEGYIHSKPRSGYYVSLIDPEFLPSSHCQTGTSPGQILEEGKSYSFDFHPASISPESFPVNLWRKLYVDSLKENPKQLASYSNQQGDTALRYELQRYLARSRGVSCSLEQIVLCSGLQDSLSILAPILKENHSQFAIEDPGHFIPKSVFRNHSFSISPVPLNSDGLAIDSLYNTKSTVVYVTPSHQFPLGYIMPVANRLKLIDWAKNVGGVIIEDDYDSELRYYGKPIPALQGLHPEENIVYIGTFSKVLSPVLRVSYMVLPYQLLTIYNKLFGHYSTSVSLLDQRTLSKFMEQGYWERHLRKMRTVYKKKHDAIIQSIHQHFGSQANIIGQGAGLHVVLELVGNSLTEGELIHRAQEIEVRLHPLSSTYLHKSSKNPQIMLGFGSMSSNEIDRGIELLYQAWYP